jgi:hypothetical protein
LELSLSYGKYHYIVPEEMTNEELTVIRKYIMGISRQIQEQIAGKIEDFPRTTYPECCASTHKVLREHHARLVRGQ